MTLYLASASPRRAQLIKLLGVRNIVISSTHVEEIHDGLLPPSDYAVQLALDKANALLPKLAPNDDAGVVVGADTIVVLADQLLEKPIDESDAKRMLRQLSGNTHIVYTGVALVDTRTKKARTFLEKTSVTFRELSDKEIDQYVAGGSPMDKAGSYGIQDDHGAVFISRIEGDYYNVVGLPLCSLYVNLIDIAPELFS
jgi:septum formation protein